MTNAALAKRNGYRKPPGVPHYGPKARIVSIYADSKLFDRVKERADSLGLSVSKYILLICREDVRKGGILELRPGVD